MPRDRSQLPILIGMLVLTAVIVAAVIFEPRWVGDRKEKRKTGPVPRVSLLPAGEKPLSVFDAAFVLMRPLDMARIAPVERFDFPLGSEHGALSYNAQPFRENRHLGDDWNGIGGWDSDFGDPVYAVGAGLVLFAGRPSDGWGNMVIVAHRLANAGGKVVQSVYAHLEAMHVTVGDRVHRGQELGTVGKGAGQYLAHLHFEMRDTLSLNPGAGYADEALDRFSPSEFIAANRGAGPETLSPAPERADEVPDWRSLEIRMDDPGGEPAPEPAGVDDEGEDRGEEGETVRELRQ